ncbi:MAG: tetratricopeptide repeat protein [bacterium]|nr:tetratricopeptide repeat protein [bacterium]
MAALRMNHVQEAERLAAGVLRSNRGDILAAQILGRALLIQNRATEAIAPLERAVRHAASAEGEMLLALALSAVGRGEEAFELLRQATARRPHYPPAFLEYGGLLARKGRFDKAVAVLEEGLALTPGSIELRMELGFVHLKRNDRAKARDMMGQALAAAPGRPDILAALARMMAMDGEYAAAADGFRNALGQRPDDVMSRVNLGVCLLEMNQREAGEASLRAALLTAPGLTGMAVTTLAAASHGRFFLRPSAAAKFLREP